MKIKVFLMLFGILLSGCSHFTPPLEQPVIEQKLNERLFKNADIGTLSLTPERRVVLINFTNKRFCAEAPTEVGADLSRLVKATAKAQKGSELKAGLGAIIAASSSNAVLNRRTQGMQLFLANSYFMCQMYLNDAINGEGLVEMQLRALNAVAPLIEREIEYLYTQAPGDSKEYEPLNINEILKEILKEGGQGKTDGLDNDDSAGPITEGEGQE